MGINPSVVRLVFVLLALLLPGAGLPVDIIGYLALGFLLPKSDRF